MSEETSLKGHVAGHIWGSASRAAPSSSEQLWAAHSYIWSPGGRLHTKFTRMCVSKSDGHGSFFGFKWVKWVSLFPLNMGAFLAKPLNMGVPWIRDPVNMVIIFNQMHCYWVLRIKQNMTLLIQLVNIWKMFRYVKSISWATTSFL